MRKVNLTDEQCKSILTLKEMGHSREYVIDRHAAYKCGMIHQSWGRPFTSLNDLSVDEMARALYVNYGATDEEKQPVSKMVQQAEPEEDLSTKKNIMTLRVEADRLRNENERLKADLVQKGIDINRLENKLHNKEKECEQLQCLLWEKENKLLGETMKRVNSSKETGEIDLTKNKREYTFAVNEREIKDLIEVVAVYCFNNNLLHFVDMYRRGSLGLASLALAVIDNLRGENS